MKKLLFICSRNRRRSPTAETVFCNDPEFEVRSAGTSRNAENPVEEADILRADYIFVMQAMHRKQLNQMFGKRLSDRRLVCLGIPDKFKYMDPELVRILKSKIQAYFGRPDETT